MQLCTRVHSRIPVLEKEYALHVYLTQQATALPVQVLRSPTNET